MRLCVFEDRHVDGLEPLTFCRPAFALLCGASDLLSKHIAGFAATEVGALVRPELAVITRLAYPELAVNDLDWVRAAPTVFVNSRWLPDGEAMALADEPCVGIVNDELAFAVLAPSQLTYCSLNTLDDCLETWRHTLPQRSAGGTMLCHPWQLIEHNASALATDLARLRHQSESTARRKGLTIIGPADEMLIDPSAEIEPMTVFDTRPGPVIVAAEVRVQAFSRLEGPCYVGPGTWIMGAKIRGGSIGPVCRVGGEVEASILQGYVNKYHDGFLGHSVVGEWVNLAAGVQVSDLRHDYGEVVMRRGARTIPTGMTKVGAFIGDYTRLGLNALVNTGSIMGCFCNVLPSGGYVPRDIPSFTSWWNGRLVEAGDVPALFATADVAMRRRGREFSDAHAVLLDRVYRYTEAARRRALRIREPRRLRQTA